MAKTATELRALVDAANQLVFEAQQHAMNAKEAYKSAQIQYAAISDKLTHPYPAVGQTIIAQNTVDEMIGLTSRMIEQANTYKAGI